MWNIFKEFLETSTIHGLRYISVSNRKVKLFWILIVIAGFTGAVFLIDASFKTWHERPVVTNIETLPIRDIRLPKVSVCPPKRTFTNLNYDLMMTENMTLDSDTKNALTQYAVELFHDYHFKEFLYNFSLFDNEMKFVNWYHGYTNMGILPFWGILPQCQGTTETDNIYFALACKALPDLKEQHLIYYVNTSTSGSISSQFFMEQFNASRIPVDFILFLSLRNPYKEEYRNTTLNYLIKRNPLKDFEICMVLENGMPVDITKKSNWDKVLNITGPNYIICYRKKVSLDKLEKMQMDNMPGFSIKWNFSHKTNPQDNDEEYIFLNDQFRR